MKFQTVLCPEIGNELFIGVRGFAAQFVVEVHDAEDHTELLPQFQQ